MNGGRGEIWTRDTLAGMPPFQGDALVLPLAKHRVVFIYLQSGDDLRNFEPRKWLKFEDIDKSMQELRAIFKVHPEWFEISKLKSDKGQNAVDYSIK